MPNLLEKLRALAETEKQATAGPWGDGIPSSHADFMLAIEARNALKELLASWFAQHDALVIGRSMQKPGDIWSVQPDRLRAFQAASEKALKLATTPHP